MPSTRSSPSQGAEPALALVLRAAGPGGMGERAGEVQGAAWMWCLYFLMHS